MELLKDYDCTIFYHPNKSNMVANTLSHKSMSSLAYILEMKRTLIEEIHKLEINSTKFEIKESRVLLAHVKLWLTLIDQIKAIKKKKKRSPNG